MSVSAAVVHHREFIVRPGVIHMLNYPAPDELVVGGLERPDEAHNCWERLQHRRSIVSG